MNAMMTAAVPRTRAVAASLRTLKFFLEKRCRGCFQLWRLR